MPGPWSRTDTRPPEQVTSTAAPSGLHLRALSSRLPTARVEALALAVDPGRPVSNVEANVARAGVGGWPRPRRPPPAWSSRSGAGGAWRCSPRASSARSPTRVVSSSIWVSTSSTSTVAVVGRELVEPADHLEVGAQAGERGAQLVAGVEHELALGLARALQGGQQVVEGAAQAAQLVGPPGVEALGDVGGLGHVLDRPRSARSSGTRAVRPTSHPRRRARAMPPRATSGEGQAQVGQLAVHPAERGGQLEGPAGVNSATVRDAAVDHGNPGRAPGSRAPGSRCPCSLTVSK